MEVFTPISTIAHLRNRTPRRDAVTVRALVVHRQTLGAYLCSADGIEPTRGSDGWLPKRALTLLNGSEPPFILVRASSSLLTRKRLFGFEPATLKGDWTEEQQAAWRQLMVAASGERTRTERRHNFDRHNGNHYA
jgi:hypothetical protein